MTPNPVAPPAAPQTSTAAAFIAAFISLLGLPVGGALFSVITSGEVGEAWNEGGWVMYVVLLLSFVLALGGAIGTYFLARGRPAVWTLIPGLSVLLMAAGVFGYLRNVSQSMAAVAYASPLDRGRIMFAAVGESMVSVVFALALIAGAYLVQALALAIVAAASAQKRAPAALALGVLGIGIWQFASMRGMSWELGAFKSMAHASSTDRAILVIISLQEAQATHTLVLAGVGIALFAVMLAAVLLRSTPQAMAGVSASIVISLVGLGGLKVLAKPNADATAVLALNKPPRELMKLPATPDEGPYPFVTLGKSLLDVDGQPADFATVVGGKDTVELGLEPGVTREVLVQMLRDLKAADVKVVELFGTSSFKLPEDVTVPPVFAPVLSDVTSVRVVLADSCPADGCAEVDETGLTFDGEKYPFVERAMGYHGEDLSHAVPVELGDMKLERFFQCALALDAKSMPIQLVLP